MCSSACLISVATLIIPLELWWVFESHFPLSSTASAGMEVMTGTEGSVVRTETDDLKNSVGKFIEQLCFITIHSIPYNKSEDCYEDKIQESSPPPKIRQQKNPTLSHVQDSNKDIRHSHRQLVECLFFLCTLASIHREKRAIPESSKDTCKMLVVADHRFFKYMGRGEESTTINYLVGTVTICWSKWRKVEVIQ